MQVSGLFRGELGIKTQGPREKRENNITQVGMRQYRSNHRVYTHTHIMQSVGAVTL